jgi:hypothetical protein
MTFIMASGSRNFKGKVFWIPIAGSCRSHYNEWIIREGPMSRGQVEKQLDSSVERMDVS